MTSSLIASAMSRDPLYHIECLTAPLYTKYLILSLASPVGLSAVLTRHAGAPRLHRRRLAAAPTAPRAQHRGGDVGALWWRRAVDRQIEIALGQPDDVLPSH